MGIARGTNIVRDGLVFGYDTGYGVANTAVSIRFYKGKPATNLASGLTKAFSNWSGLVGTTEYYTRNGSQGVRLVVTTGGGVRWHDSNQINNVSSSTQYTVSATVKWDGVTPSPNLFYIRQYNSSGNQVTENGYFSTSYMIDLGDGWYRAYRTFTTTSTTDFVKIQGYQYAAGADIYYQDEQFELGALTPYTGDGATRSNTASLIDLKRNIDIDVSSVSFDSTGQPTFDGSDDRGVVENFPHVWDSSVSMECIIKFEDSNRSIIFGNYNVGSNDVNFEKLTTGNLRFYWNRGERDVTTSNNVVTQDGSKYHHCVFVRDTTNNNFKFYVDGALVNTVSNAGTNLSEGSMPTNHNKFRIGADTRTGSTVHNGEIPIIKVYNKALSATEVTQNYNAYKNRFNL